MTEREQLERAIAQIEAQRPLLGDATADAALAGLRQQLAVLDETEPSTPDLHGERRQATILLADVVGSTALAEQVDTEAWVEIMNRVFHLLGEAIYRHGGEIEQYRGDGLMAFFGAKAAHEDDPERAVRAGLAMQEAVQAYATDLEKERGIELRLRVGVNSGEVIAAEVGDRRRHSEDTAMGRAIALAARMESAAQPGTVLVTADTYRLTRRLFEWQSLGEITVKGVSQPVTVFRPLAVRAIEGKGRGIEGLSSPLVGRDEELAALRAAVDELRRGVGGIVTLVGEAGIGKSRLVAELRKRVPDDQVRWFEGRCLSYGGSIAYLPWLDWLRSLLNVAPDAPSLDVRAALRGRVQALCPDCFDAVYPYLCRLLSLPLEDAYAELRDLQGESLRAEVFWAVQTLVEGATRGAPLVTVFEDLHWADATSLALLERVLALTDRAPLLALCVFRPEMEHGCWQLKETAARLYRHRHTDLSLEALSAEESQALVGHLLRIEDLPAALRTRVLERAEGNPFYAEEIIRSLIDDGAIVHDDASGRWRATREVADIPIPDTLHGVLAGRIDRLEERTRRVLRMASVIGRVFPYRVLSEIAPDEADLDTRLLTLQRQQLVRERARLPELEYIFKHELTREAAYGGLLVRERRACHRQVAEALERLYLAQVEEQAGLLARHWEGADEPQKAVTYLRKAGEQARLSYANVEAANHYRRALRLADALPADASRQRERLTALSGLGKVYFSSGRVGDAEEPLREAIALGKRVGLPARELVRIYWWLCEVLFWQTRWADQLRVAEEGLTLLEEDAGSVEAALMSGSIAVAHNFLRDQAEARAYMQRAVQMVQRVPYVEELRAVYTNACWMIHMRARDVARTEKWVSSFEDKARGHHDLRGLGEAREQMGALCYAQGRLAQAISEHERALDLYARIGDTRLVGTAMLRLSQAHIARGVLSEAETLVRRYLEMEKTMGSAFHHMLALGLAGMVACCSGRSEEAVSLLREALKSERSGSWYSLWAPLLAGVYLRLGRRPQALEQLRTQGIPANPTGYEPLLLPTLSVLEQACEAPEDLSALCCLYREQCPALQDAPYSRLVGWYLEPATIGNVREPSLPGLRAGPLLPEQIWVDPYADCSYKTQDGLVIHAANGRDIWHINWSAPRMVQEVAGDLVAQTVCTPAMDDRPAIGGLLLWRDEKNYLRLDRGAYGENEIAFLGCVSNEDAAIGRGWLRGTSGPITLRLERRGDQVSAYCSADGERWFTAGHVTFPVQDPVQVGMHAIGNIARTIYPGAYPDGTAIRFESFQIWQMED